MGTAHKVLMLVENLPVPGGERVWSEAKTLRDHGFQVSVICPSCFALSTHRSCFSTKRKQVA